MKWDAALSRSCVELGEVLNFGTVRIQLPVQVVLAKKQEQKKQHPRMTLFSNSHKHKK